ncbi:MAG: hypothetical protein V4760_08205 [Bdellovibrionota bacterium]
MKTSIERILLVTRLRDWVYLLGIAMLAIAKYRGVVSAELGATILVFNGVYLCWGYVFNNLFDQGEDDPIKNPFLVLERARARWITFALTFLLIALAAWFGLLAETLSVMALNVAYSVSPIRLKRWIVPSLAANGVFFGFVYYSAVKLIPTAELSIELPVCVFVFLLFLPLQYVHHLEHRELARAKVRSFDRLVVACSFAAVIAWVFTNPVLAVIRLETLAYSVVCVVLVGDRRTSALVLRRIFRWISAAFGIAMLLKFGSWL